jgi:hypothetical protein
MHLWINLTSGARVIKLEISARDKRPVHSAVQDCCFGHSERYAALVLTPPLKKATKYDQTVEEEKIEIPNKQDTQAAS